MKLPTSLSLPNLQIPFTSLNPVTMQASMSICQQAFIVQPIDARGILDIFTSTEYSLLVKGHGQLYPLLSWTSLVDFMHGRASGSPITMTFPLSCYLTLDSSPHILCLYHGLCMLKPNGGMYHTPKYVTGS